jgi:starvation-inducible outer membrane lipoprotein
MKIKRVCLALLCLAFVLSACRSSPKKGATPEEARSATQDALNRMDK